MAEEADEKMRRAAQDAAKVEAENSRELFGLENEAKGFEQEAQECDNTVQSLSSVVDPLEQFLNAMETVTHMLPHRVFNSNS